VRFFHDHAIKSRSAHQADPVPTAAASRSTGRHQHHLEAREAARCPIADNSKIQSEWPADPGTTLLRYLAYYPPLAFEGYDTQIHRAQENPQSPNAEPILNQRAGTNSDGQHKQLVMDSRNNFFCEKDVKKKVKMIKSGPKASRRYD
jgi:hypothetical protein